MGEEKEEKVKRGRLLQLLIVADSLLLEFTNKTKNPTTFFFFGRGGGLTSQRVLKGHHRKSKSFEDQDHSIKLVASS